MHKKCYILNDYYTLILFLLYHWGTPMFYYFISKSRKFCADVTWNIPNLYLFSLKALFTIPHTALKVFIYDVISALSKNKRPY